MGIFIVICLKVILNFFFDFIVDPQFFSDKLLSLHVIVSFFFFFLWLISSFMQLWSEHMLEIISVLLNLLRVVWGPIYFSLFYEVDSIVTLREVKLHLGHHMLIN